MKRVFLIVMFLLVSGCSSQSAREIHLPEIMNIEGKNFISAAALNEHEINIPEPDSGEFTVNLANRKAPIYMNCGGVYWHRFDEGKRILEDANLVLDFKGVKEVWVPIEGKPKKLYIFEVR